ncbi:hypothetical protein ERO13_D10G244524v2 [Gossypium hirsutum]|nr:hypothetical protein ERO13_D10G244524v2 [Gossypium hirsutum]
MGGFLISSFSPTSKVPTKSTFIDVPFYLEINVKGIKMAMIDILKQYCNLSTELPCLSH